MNKENRTKLSIDIICPLYNAEEYIENLNKQLLMQDNVYLNKIRYILTESKDNTEEILLKNKCSYKKISKEKFSHSLTREEEAFKSKADIIVFITQDINIKDELWLYNLTKDITCNSEIVATFSRQISKYNNIEKYTREYNYPNKSRTVSKKDITTLNLKTFFFSDASAAIRRDIFVKLNGYDNKDLPISEDMYIAYKIIMNGYKIKYCSDSIVYHSHKFKLKEIYKRYKLTGKFFKDNDYLKKYKINGSGKNLAIYIFKEIIKEHKINLLIRYPFDMAARFIGMKVGEK